MEKVTYGSWHSFWLGHGICACLLIIDYLKVTRTMLFALVVMGTLLVSVEDLPGKILEQALSITLLPLLGAFLCTVVWALASFPMTTANAPSQRLALPTVRAAIAHFSRLALTAVKSHSASRSGAVAGNVAGPSGSDMFRVFFYSFVILGLYYLQWEFGSNKSFGAAHFVYLSLLRIELEKPKKEILYAFVLLLTIVFTSGVHPRKIVENFEMLITMSYICIPIGVLAVFCAWLTSGSREAVTFWGRVRRYLPFLPSPSET